MLNTKDHPDQLPLTIHKQGPFTQEEVARLLGITRQAVQDGERRAIRKLKKVIEQNPSLRECLLQHLENEARPVQSFYRFVRENM